MASAKEIFDYINELAPYSMQAGYDNSGLNVGSADKEVKRIIVSLDATNEVCEEARLKDCDMVITHHPVIFRGLKRLDPTEPAVRLAIDGICALSMHTNFDSASGGMNDLLCERLGLTPKEPLAVEDGVPIGYVCDWDYSAPITARRLAEIAKEALGCKAVRFCCGEKEVTRVAVCSGSGGSFLRAAAAKGCNALITGDVKHDIFIDAHNMDFAVIDAGHFYTENIFFEYLKTKLSERFPEIEVIEAKSNEDVTDIL
ncbi:MAG: Nif3-like dinuclear metal center hexameric protein [Oscillospiraceae bacterium]